MSNPQSRSVQRRVAAQKGEPVPTFPHPEDEMLGDPNYPPLRSQPAGAERLKGWQDAINSVRASLQQYPNAGGDITIMAEVERILAAKDAEIAELRGIRGVVVTLLVKLTGWTRDRVEESPFNAAEAAERDRDSLREAIARQAEEMADECEAEDFPYSGDKSADKLRELASRIRAALKAGKETKK